MNRYPKLVWPAYLIAFMLIAIPLFDASMSVFPFALGSEQWRFGAIGLISNAFIIPAAGLLIALVTALTFGHFGFLRVLGFLCLFGSAGFFILLLLFVLDSVQVRMNITPQAKLAFVVASITAGAKLILASITLIFIGRAGLKSRQGTDRAVAKRSASPSPVGPAATG
jgi:hypothetical protein